VDVTVLVVNFRTPDLALRAMADARASAGGLEVEELFVDNGSGDDGAARLGSGRPSAVVLQEPTNRGFGAGVNAGLRAARGRVVVEVNSDAFCEGDAVRASSPTSMHIRASPSRLRRSCGRTAPRSAMPTAAFRTP
jgi:GT2 family glycosyltransferase